MPHILSAGFRPFFLFAGLYGTFPLVFWIATLAGEVTLPGPMSPTYWHGHEMVFGFGVAGMAGFLLTAMPSWTATPPLKGWPLAGLAALWIIGRAAMWGGWGLGVWTVAVADLALLVALCAVLGAKVMASGKARNYPPVVLVVLLLIANGLMHLDTLDILDGSAAIGLRGGVFVFCLLVALIGGRVIPAFTANVLKARGDGTEVASWPMIEKLAMASLILAIVLDLAVAGDGPWRMVAGAVAIVAGLALMGRMGRWRLVKILDDPILWILHLGHIWLAVGFVLKGLADLSDLIAPGDAIHALSAGAMGTMIMAMMTRAALGHTGRPMKAPPAIVVAYVLVLGGAVLRVVGPTLGAHFAGDMEAAIIATGGLMWVAGFVVFSAVFWPILTRPKLQA